MNHIAINFHFVRDKVASGILCVSHISTHDQPVDLFTKPLSMTRHDQLRLKLMSPMNPLSCRDMLERIMLLVIVVFEL